MKEKTVGLVIGTCQIYLRGDQTERFLNVLIFRKIDILNLEWLGEEADGYKRCCIKIYKDNLGEVSQLSKKYHIEIETIVKKGIPERIQFYKKRVCFSLGAVCCFVFLLCMSNCIWKIEFQGNHYYTDEMLMKYLSKRDISYGTWRNAKSWEKEELNLRKKYDDIAWCSMSTDGCKLTVIITESKTKKAKSKKKKGWSIVADRNAKIDSIITRTGTPLVKKGDKVKKGQILVEGYILYNDDFGEIVEAKKCVADADVYGIYKEKIEWKVLKEKTVCETACETYQKGILFQEKMFYLPESLPRNYKINVLTEYNQNKILARIFPLYFLKKTSFLKEERNDNVSFKEGKVILEQKMARYCKKMAQKGIKIIEKNYHIEDNKKEVVLKGNVKIGKYFNTYKKSKLSIKGENTYGIDRTGDEG